MMVLKGESIVSRIAFGKARVCLSSTSGREEPSGSVPPDQIANEEKRADTARAAVVCQLQRAYCTASGKVDEKEAEIFRMHEELLNDPAFKDAIVSRIRERRLPASSAIRESVAHFKSVYESSPVEKIRMVAADICGLGEQLLDALGAPSEDWGAFHNEPCICFVSWVCPRFLMQNELRNIAGFVAERGGVAAHASILARALEIPMIVNVGEGIASQISDGDRVIVDGFAGEVIINPHRQREAACREAYARLEDARGIILSNRDLPAVTVDHVFIGLEANISLAPEWKAANRLGGEGIGLFRSEFPYMRRENPPTEEDVMGEYIRLAGEVYPKPVVIRALDIGGEKIPAYCRMPDQENPMLGLRALRLLRTHRQLFVTQLRAILRAGAARSNIRLLLPMISCMEELREAKKVLEECREELKRDELPFQAKMPLGLMVEIPSAALCIRELLAEADFASIGSNDLTQYVHCADRGNGYVADLYDPASRAVMELIRRVVEAGEELRKPVTLCGEIAGTPLYVPLLLGLGVKRLSMNPDAIPLVKEMIRHVDLHGCNALAREVMQCVTRDEVSSLLERFSHSLHPAE